MEKTENLYELLETKVKENIEDKRKKEKLEEKAQERASINDRYYLVTNEIKAYFYYKYFIKNIFSEYLKQHIKEIDDIDKDKAKDRYFRLYLRVSYSTKKEIDFQKFYQAFYLSFNKPITCEFFSEYMESFSQRLGVKREDYSDSFVFSFEKVKIKDALVAYYGELQRFEQTDELIKSIQEEENTFVNGEEIINGINRNKEENMIKR